MFKICEKGRSMVEMLGVLAVIGVLSAGGLAGYSKAMYRYKLSKTIDVASSGLREFSFFIKKDVSGYNADKEEMAQKAKSTGLLPDCEVAQSQLSSDYQVCRVPLGEIYPRFFISEGDGENYYTYMMYVTLLSSQTSACVDFLARGWDQMLPERFWRHGKIWLTSDKGSQLINLSAQNALSVGNLLTPCSNVCASGAAYCSIVFDFSGYSN